MKPLTSPKPFIAAVITSFMLCLTFLAPPTFGGEAQDLMGKAYGSYQAQQWDSAVAHLEKALAIYPRYAEAHHLLGLIYSQTGKPDQAVRHLQKAVEAYPAFAQAFLDLGYAHQQTARLREAESAFTKSLELYPNFLESRMALASLHDQAQHPAKAITAHKGVLELAPNQTESLYGVAFWLTLEGKLKEAQPYVDRLLAHDPSHAHGWIMAGSIAQQLDQIDKAIKAYQQAVKLNTDVVEPYFQLGILHQQQEDYQQAAEAFEQVVRLEPRNAEAHINLGVVYAAMAKVDQAEKAYLTALEINPALPDCHYNLGLLYEFHRNAPQKAMNYYQEYVKLGGNDQRIVKLLERMKS
jgi:tetratricopeptide (TPR) repeat protein